jgi:hypothetical protein
MHDSYARYFVAMVSVISELSSNLTVFFLHVGKDKNDHTSGHSIAQTSFVTMVTAKYMKAMSLTVVTLQCFSYGGKTE